MIKSIWKSLLTGYTVLLAAIAMNGLALSVGLLTWYGFFEDPSPTLLDGLFLFLIYPLTLGGAALLAQKIWDRAVVRGRDKHKSH